MNKDSMFNCTLHIVENIFQHLTAKDLCVCASVCTLWAAVSKEQIQKRKEIVPFIQVLKCGTHSRMHEIGGECEMSQASKFESELKTQLEDLQIKPAFCIAFATSAFLEHFEHLFPTYFSTSPRKRLKKCYWDYFDTAVEIALQKHLPSTCCISLYIEDNIAFYDGDAPESDLVVTNSPALCGYLFPKCPEGALNFYERKESTGQILEHIAANGPNIKGTLNLIEFVFMPNFQIALTELRHRYEASISGVIMPVQVGSDYVPVFEGPNVQVFRFVADNRLLLLDKTNKLNAIMEHWKGVMTRRNGLTNKTITYMFSIGVNNYHYIYQVFKIVFPGMPIVGLFKEDPMCFRNELDNIKNFFTNPIVSSVRKNRLMDNTMFMFVTFN